MKKVYTVREQYYEVDMETRRQKWVNARLRDALNRGHAADIEHYIERGANINLYDDNKNTPLHFAIHSRNIEMIHWLLDQKADLNVQNRRGETPLALALRIDDTSLADWFLSLGADPNIPDNKGNTPLHWAIRLEQNGFAETLVKNGADVDAVSHDGYTPRRIAELKGAPEPLVDLLLKRETPEEESKPLGLHVSVTVEDWPITEPSSPPAYDTDEVLPRPDAPAATLPTPNAPLPELSEEEELPEYEPPSEPPPAYSVPTEAPPDYPAPPPYTPQREQHSIVTSPTHPEDSEPRNTTPGRNRRG